jgi:hypothetical protein
LKERISEVVHAEALHYPSRHENRRQRPSGGCKFYKPSKEVFMSFNDGLSRIFDTKAFDWLSRESTRQWTVGEAITRRTGETLTLPLRRGGRMAERTVTLGSVFLAAALVAVAANPLAAIPWALSGVLMGKVSGLFTGGVIDTGLEKAREWNSGYKLNREI